MFSMSRHLIVAASVFVFLGTIGTASATCGSLPDVSTRIGTAATFIWNWTAAEYTDDTAPRDYYWNNQPVRAQGFSLRLPAQSFSSAYTAVNRVPVHAQRFGGMGIVRACGNSPAPGGCSLDWLQRNHPAWIIYRTDQATPAYQFGDQDWIPLDISNPAVRAWLQTNQFKPLLAAGYQGISIDNVSDRNDWDEVGICSVAIPSGTCASNGGVWTKLYTGAVKGDAQFLDARVAWLKAATKFTRDHGGCSSANVTFNPADLRSTAELVDAVDIWFDENGFTGDSNPSACSPAGPGAGSVGATWVAKAKFIVGLNGGRGKPMVQQNSICPRGTSHARTKEVLEYAVASYLLTKNAHTYIAWYFDDGKTGNTSFFNDPSSWPQLSWHHGAALEAMVEVGGVYRRTFENGLALVNPSTQHDATYELSAVHEDFDGVARHGRITLPPVSALLLRHVALHPHR